MSLMNFKEVGFEELGYRPLRAGNRHHASFVFSDGSLDTRRRETVRPSSW